MVNLSHAQYYTCVCPLRPTCVPVLLFSLFPQNSICIYTLHTTLKFIIEGNPPCVVLFVVFYRKFSTEKCIRMMVIYLHVCSCGDIWCVFSTAGFWCTSSVWYRFSPSGSRVSKEAPHIYCLFTHPDLG